MTFFEYITVAVSIVLALAVARTIDGLRSTFTRDRRYWVHAVWVIVKLTNPVTFWWSMWFFRDIATWNVLSFALFMAWPVVLYLQVTSLVSRQPELVADWRVHFYEQRRWFFGANILIGLLPFGSFLLLGGNPVAIPISAGLLVVVAYSVVGLATDNAKIQGIIAITAAIGVVLGFWVPAFTPRSLVP